MATKTSLFSENRTKSRTEFSEQSWLGANPIQASKVN